MFIEYFSPITLISIENRFNTLFDWGPLIEAVRSGSSVRRVAADFDIPVSTIYDRLSGKVPEWSVCGHSRYLSDTEENELESFRVLK
jgi:hypothetical protein